MSDELFAIVRACQHFNINVDFVGKKYAERQRYYHTLDHIETFFKDIPYKENSREWNIWVLAAIFHDLMYDPRAVDDTNEKKSIEFFKKDMTNRLLHQFRSPDIGNAVIDLIWSTRPSKPFLLRASKRNLTVEIGCS